MSGTMCLRITRQWMLISVAINDQYSSACVSQSGRTISTADATHEDLGCTSRGTMTYLPNRCAFMQKSPTLLGRADDESAWACRYFVRNETLSGHRGVYLLQSRPMLYHHCLDILTMPIEYRDEVVDVIHYHVCSRMARTIACSPHRVFELFGPFLELVATAISHSPSLSELLSIPSSS